MFPLPEVFTRFSSIFIISGLFCEIIHPLPYTLYIYISSILCISPPSNSTVSKFLLLCFNHDCILFFQLQALQTNFLGDHIQYIIASSESGVYIYAHRPLAWTSLDLQGRMGNLIFLFQKEEMGLVGIQ